MPGYIAEADVWQPGNIPFGGGSNPIDVDLEAGTPSIVEAGRIQGVGLTFRTVVTNVGTTAWPPGVVLRARFDVDGTPVSWSDTHVAGLNPGASVTLTANSGTGGAAKWSATPGNHALSVEVDDLRRYIDVDRANNVASSTFTITPVVVASSTFKHGVFIGHSDGNIAAEVASQASVTGTTPRVGLSFSINPSAGFYSDNELDGCEAWVKSNAANRLLLKIRVLGSDRVRQYDSTEFDAAHGALAANITARGIAARTSVTLGWEFDGVYGFPWQSASNDPAAKAAAAAGYVRMWNRLASQQWRVHAPLVDLTWSAQGFIPASCAPWYPNNAYVDTISMSRYNAWTVFGNPTPAARWAGTRPQFVALADFADARGKAKAVDELGPWNDNNSPPGSSGGGDDPTFVNGVADVFAERGFKRSLWFNSPEGGVGVTFADLPKTLAAYRARFGGFTS